MAKSSKEFDLIIFKILKRLNEGNKIDDIIPEHDNHDYFDALNLCIDNGYIIGLTLKFSADNIPNLSQQGTPHLSYSGLKTLEELNSSNVRIDFEKIRLEVLSDFRSKINKTGGSQELLVLRLLDVSSKIAKEMLIKYDQAIKNSK